MRCLGVIPTRMSSTRLPGKPLKDIAGKTLIQRVWEQAKKANKLTKLVIASEDEAIEELAKLIGADFVMTGSHHATGSDRVAEAYAKLSENEQFDLVANIQGDMPFIRPEAIDYAIQSLSDSPTSFGMSTIARPIIHVDEFLTTSVVKVVTSADGAALYFSRAPIPFCRDGFDDQNLTEANPLGLKHLGLYVFRPDTLKSISSLSIGAAEKHEKLEQLRLLHNGVRIKVAVLSQALIEPTVEVDTEEDLQRAIKLATK